jgi:hypothetical protein
MRCLVTDAVGGASSSPGERWRADRHEIGGINNFLDDYAWQMKTKNTSKACSKVQCTFISDGINEKVFGEAVNIVEGQYVSLHEIMQIQILPEWDLCQW